MKKISYYVDNQKPKLLFVIALILYSARYNQGLRHPSHHPTAQDVITKDGYEEKRVCVLGQGKGSPS